MCKSIILIGTGLLLPVLFFGQTFHYLNTDKPFLETKQVPSQNWNEMGNVLYKGYKNGVYWIKIENLPNSVVLAIQNARILNASLYREDGQEIEPLRKPPLFSFHLSTNTSYQMFYLKIEFKKEAVVLLKTTRISEYYQNLSLKNIYLGIYYGIVGIVISINTFSFFNYRNKTYVHYIMMLLSITLGLVTSDGLFHYFFNSEYLDTYLEPFFNLMVALVLPILANSYMDLKDHLPKVNTVGMFLGGISIMLFFCYLISGEFIVFAWTEVVSLLLVTYYWLAGAYIFKKSFEARVFTIAYFVICISCYDYYVARSFGFQFIGLSLDEFRIGAIIEMIVFTFAIHYRTKILIDENRKMLDLLRLFSKGEEGKQLIQQERNAKLVQCYNLTPKEIQVLKLIVRDKINKEIADELNISINTVKYHIKNIYTKLQISSRQEARQRFYSLE